MARKFKDLSKPKKIVVGVVVAFVALVGIGSISPAPKQATLNIQSASKTSVLGAHTTKPQTQTKPKAAAPVITTQTETETQPVPFTSSTINTSTLPKGQKKVTTIGVNGVSTLTYKLTFTNGTQTNKQLISQLTTTQPVNQVTSIGTYVAPTSTYTPPSAPALNCPNGTYINSVGNRVCSPYASSSAPAGATAQCRDGTYSFSQSHSGTCSSHGGVLSWL